jgi:hypothetical protein
VTSGCAKIKKADDLGRSEIECREILPSIVWRKEADKSKLEEEG